MHIWFLVFGLCLVVWLRCQQHFTYTHSNHQLVYAISAPKEISPWPYFVDLTSSFFFFFLLYAPEDFVYFPLDCKWVVCVLIVSTMYNGFIKVENQFWGCKISFNNLSSGFSFQTGNTPMHIFPRVLTFYLPCPYKPTSSERYVFTKSCFSVWWNIRNLTGNLACSFQSLKHLKLPTLIAKAFQTFKCIVKCCPFITSCSARSFLSIN